MITHICIIACYDGTYTQNAFAFEVGSGLLLQLYIGEMIDFTEMENDDIEKYYPGFDLYLVVEDGYVSKIFTKKEAAK